MLNVVNKYNQQSFGLGVKISRGIAFELSQKPKIVQRYIHKSLDSLDKYSKQNNLDINISKQSLSRGYHNLHADYIRIDDGIRGSVIKKEKFLWIGSFSSLQKKLK